MIFMPDLTATSFYRPASPGAHGKYKAIDLAIKGGLLAMDFDNGGADWEKWAYNYYFSVYFELYSEMAGGRIRLALPPDCLHYHIDLTDKTKKGAGYERLNNVDGHCKLQEARNLSIEAMQDFIAAWMLERYGWVGWTPEWAYGSWAVVFTRLAAAQRDQASDLVDEAFASDSIFDFDFSLLGPGAAMVAIGAIIALGVLTSKK